MAKILQFTVVILRYVAYIWLLNIVCLLYNPYVKLPRRIERKARESLIMNYESWADWTSLNNRLMKTRVVTTFFSGIYYNVCMQKRDYMTLMLWMLYQTNPDWHMAHSTTKKNRSPWYSHIFFWQNLNRPDCIVYIVYLNCPASQKWAGSYGIGEMTAKSTTVPTILQRAQN